MVIYIDNNYKCYTETAENLKLIETNFFDGKCKSFIEGYRYVPKEEVWVREDGIEFKGEMIAPWKDYNVLVAHQQQYEQMLAEQETIQAALNILIEG